MKKNKLAGNSLVKTLWQNKVAQTNISVAGIATNRSSHQRCSMKKCVLKNFVKFTGKHLCQRLFFNKVAGPAMLLKKGLWHRCSPVNFTKFLRTPFFQSTSGRLLLSLKVWLTVTCIIGSHS